MINKTHPGDIILITDVIKYDLIQIVNVYFSINVLILAVLCTNVCI